MRLFSCILVIKIIMLSIMYIGQALLFFKYYDPGCRMVSCVGHSVESIDKKFCKSTSVMVLIKHVVQCSTMMIGSARISPLSAVLLRDHLV